MEYDSALSQQSIFGKFDIVCVCVWKPGFFQIQIL